MDFGSIFNKAGETLKHLENDFTKELGLQVSGGGELKEDETDGWNEWEQEEDEWVDVENSTSLSRSVSRSVSRSNGDEGIDDGGGGKLVEGIGGEKVALKDSGVDHGVFVEDFVKLKVQSTEEAKVVTSSITSPLDRAGVREEEREKVEGVHVDQDQRDASEDGEHLLTRDVQHTQIRKSFGDEFVDGEVLRKALVESDNLRRILSETQARNNELENMVPSVTGRLEASERKVLALTKECDSLRRLRDGRNADAQLVKEKDSQIQAVLEEGQQLSIKIAEKEQMMKRMKAEMKSVEAERDDFATRLTTSEAKAESLSSKVRQLEASEQSLQEAKDAAERRLRELGNENRSRAGTAAALDAARTELESLRRSQARSSEEQEFRLRAEAQMSMENLHAEAEERERALNRMIAELRTHLAQVNEAAGWREDSLRRELADLRRRCEMLEGQNEELSASVSDSTRPLLRQIEALQGLLAERSKAIESTERNHLKRLREAEDNAAIAKEKYDYAESKITTINTRVKALEEQLKALKEERNQLSAELLDVRTQSAEQEEKMQKVIEEARNTQLKMQRSAEQDNLLLVEERNAHVEAMREADEREEELRQRLQKQEKHISHLESRLREVQTKQQAMQAGSYPNSARSTDSSENLGGLALDALYGHDRLQAALRSKADENQAVQQQLAAKEKALQNIAEEVVRLTGEVDRLKEELGDSPQTKKQLEEIQKRHDTLMILFGEREERVQELEQDLADVNTMYKEQINDLLLQNEELQRRR